MLLFLSKSGGVINPAPPYLLVSTAMKMIGRSATSKGDPFKVRIPICIGLKFKKEEYQWPSIAETNWQGQFLTSLLCLQANAVVATQQPR